MKNQKGITMMGIVITIIILLLLAGISIILLGNNGILSKTTLSVEEHKANEAKQDITIAWGSVNANYKSNNSKLKENYFTIENLNKNLEATGVLLELNFNSDSISTLKYATFSDNIVYDVEVDAQGNVTIKSKTLPTNTENSNYLVDKVQIGDYIDIGIDYTNTDKTPFFSEYLTNDFGENGPTGWRVFSKNGNGITGTVTLISAGCPIDYWYYDNDFSNSMPSIDNLYKEIDVVELPTNDKDRQKDMFLANGFNNNNLKEVFDSSGYIDISKGIHGVTIDELLTTYKILTEKKKTFEELLAQDIRPPLRTSTLINTYENFDVKAYDLLANGYTYWIKGYYKNCNSCRIGFNGDVGAILFEEFTTTQGNFGVRPVLTLKYNLKISEDNIGDGSSINLAYKLEK